MDYDYEINGIKTQLKEHSDTLSRHEKDINTINNSVVQESKKLQVFEVNMQNMMKDVNEMKTDVTGMKTKMDGMQGDIEGIRNQNTLNATNLKSIKVWVKVIAVGLLLVVASIFIAGGEFKSSLIKGIIQVLPALAK